MSESELQAAIIEAAHLLGWKVMHARQMQGKDGIWRTAYGGDGVGWPDLVLVSPRGVLFRELKAIGGRLSTEQSDWLAELEQAGADVGIWTPIEWRDGTIIKELGGDK